MLRADPAVWSLHIHCTSCLSGLIQPKASATSTDHLDQPSVYVPELAVSNQSAANRSAVPEVEAASSPGRTWQKAMSPTLIVSGSNTGSNMHTSPLCTLGISDQPDDWNCTLRPASSCSFINRLRDCRSQSTPSQHLRSSRIVQPISWIGWTSCGSNIR